MVIARNVQVLCHFKIVRFIIKSHQIVGNHLLRRDLPDDIRLHLQEIIDQVRGKPFPVQFQRRAVHSRHCPWRRDLGKVVIFLAPEHGAPCGIQIRNRLIFSFQPALEASLAAWAHAQIFMAVSQLIIYLPADYPWLILVLPGHFLH